MNKRTIIVIGILILLLGGGYWYYDQQVNAVPILEVIREATAERGVIEATVNATGSIEPEALVSLTFGMGGTVRELKVVRGAVVQVGDVLASLDTEELALAVQQAEDGLRIQQLSYDQRANSQPSVATMAGATADIQAAEANVVIAEANLAQAKAAVLQAQAQKAQLQAGPTADLVAAAQAELAARSVDVERLQDSYDQIINNGIGGVVEEQTRFQLDAVRKAYTAAEARLNALYAPPRTADLQAADARISSAQAGVLAAEGSVAASQAQLARVQASYDRLLEPIGEAELAIMKAQIQSAETTVALANLRLRQSQIVAPIAGKIANVLVEQGEQTAPGAPALILVNENAYHLDVSVDEIDIDQVVVGQSVMISLDALPDQKIEGVIAEIAPTASNIGGVVTYFVTINITNAGDIALRPNMSANASIVINQIADVLVVPNWAIRLNRQTGEAFVNRQNGDGTIEEVAVEIGLRNELFSQVVSGLSVGDKVVVTNEREGLNLFGGQ